MLFLLFSTFETIAVTLTSVFRMVVFLYITVHKSHFNKQFLYYITTVHNIHARQTMTMVMQTYTGFSWGEIGRKFFNTVPGLNFTFVRLA